MTVTARRAVAYLRVSTEAQTEGFGLEIQSAMIDELALLEGYEIVGRYSDDGVSGKEELEARTGLVLVLDAIAQGTADVVLIPRLDRLARDLIVQEQILADFWREGADVISCSPSERIYCQPDHPEDPARTLIRQVLGAVAAYERAMIRLRMTRGRRRLLDQQGWAGGPVPYGWECADEQELLADVSVMRTDGTTWRAICGRLNAAGRFKRNGGPWTAAELQRTHSRAAVRLTVRQ
jgi:DNA invertase Pin-like site-specific DNA recombinase